MRQTSGTSSKAEGSLFFMQPMNHKLVELCIYIKKKAFKINAKMENVGLTEH